MVSSAALIELIDQLQLQVDKEAIIRACEMSAHAHRLQIRDSGEPYYNHPLEVAAIVIEMKLDTASIITALLHDTIEDTDLTLEDIEKAFGSDVAKLVDGVTKLAKIKFSSDHARQAENFRKLLLAMSEDIRVLLVKLADRLHNMRTIHHIKSPERRLRIAHETMEIYSPLAERIGIHKIKNELQDVSFSIIHPEAHNSIVNRLQFLRREGHLIVDRILSEIKRQVNEVVEGADITGREKTPCSIWQKMELKNISFDQLSDIIAFRILVPTVQDCYTVLGIIHSSYHMVPGSFKDFISTPKGNNYQSIHTVVVGPEQQRIEVQIRTFDMHEVAELGVAAHWGYKQLHESKVDGKQYRWIRELLNILDNATDPEDLLEHSKLEIYYDQVFCFTPQGKLIALPRNATPVDFAFALHSDIGSTCVSAKVNGRIVPLNMVLNNGDQVEIIRSKTQTPSPSWEKFVVTGKARSFIKKFIRSQQRQEYINLGKAILTKDMKGLGFEVSEKVLAPVLEAFRRRTLDDLFVAVGEGNISRSEIAKALEPSPTLRSSLKSRLSLFRFVKRAPLEEDAMPIRGLIPGMAMHFATCCHPLPGDRIVGIVNVGKGVTVHTADCGMLESFSASPERWLEVSWAKNDREDYHTGRIKILISHEVGALAMLTNTIAKEAGNISNLKIAVRTVDFFELIIDIEVKGAQHLANIITSLRSQACVHSVARMKV